jgi:hypothetical protein
MYPSLSPARNSTISAIEDVKGLRDSEHESKRWSKTFGIRVKAI